MRHSEWLFPAEFGLVGKHRRFHGGGDSPPQTSTTTTMQNYSPEELAARTKIWGAAGNLYDSGVGGSAPVSASADTTAAQNRLRTFATGQGQDVANTAGQALQFGLHDVLNPTSNPGFQQSLDSATRRVGEAYTDPGGVLSKIRSGFIGDNAAGGSGTREGIAGGLAARSYLNTVGDVTGKMTSDAYTQGLDTFNKTLAFAPNAYNLMTQPALTQGAVGTQMEGYDQAQRDYTANAPWLQLGNYANIVYGGSNPSTTTTGTAPGPTANKAAPLGMAMQGAAMGSMFGPMGTGIGAGAGLLMGLM